MSVELPNEGMDALSLPKMKEKSLQHITKLFYEADLPQTEMLCIIYEKQDEVLVKELVNNFFCDYYQKIIGEMHRTKRTVVLFQKTIH